MKKRILPNSVFLFLGIVLFEGFCITINIKPVQAKDYKNTDWSDEFSDFDYIKTNPRDTIKLYKIKEIKVTNYNKDGNIEFVREYSPVGKLRETFQNYYGPRNMNVKQIFFNAENAKGLLIDSILYRADTLKLLEFYNFYTQGGKKIKSLVTGYDTTGNELYEISCECDTLSDTFICDTAFKAIYTYKNELKTNAVIHYSENQEIEKYSYKYDEGGVVTEVEHSNRYTNNTVKYEYDSLKRLSKESTFNEFHEGMLNDYHVYTYSKSGDMIKIEWYNSPDPVGITEMSYDNNHNMTEKNIYDLVGQNKKMKYSEKYNYSYNKKMQVVELYTLNWSFNTSGEKKLSYMEIKKYSYLKNGNISQSTSTTYDVDL